MNAKSALVTGASRGIGRGIAEHLAGKGYGLTITSRQRDDVEALRADLLRAGAPAVRAVEADMADRDSLDDLVDLHAEEFGSMHALILNAGVGSAGDVSSYSTRRLEKTLQVNFLSAFTLIQRALPLLRNAAAATPTTGAKIIGLSSITGVFAEPGLAAYGASKAAMLSLLEAVNLEEADRGVTATGVAPAFVATDMSAWATDRVPVEKMIPISDVVALVGTLVELSSNVSIGRIVLSRSGTNGTCA